MENKISVIMINELDNKELLQQCIASIKLQQCKNGKGLVVGGKDYNRAELLNKGLELGGEANYILYVNTYEELKEGYINKCMDVFNKYSHVNAVYTDYDKTYAGGIREYLPSFNRAKITQGWSMPTTAMFKREVFDICGNFDTSLAILEDWDMWLRITEKFPLYHIPESLYIAKTNINREISSKVLEQTKKNILEKANQRTNGN